MLGLTICRRWTFHCALTAVLMCPTVGSAWETKEDNKPDDVLQRMSDEELVDEALDVCARRALLMKGADDTATPDLVATDAATYLSHLAYVATAPRGETPPWLSEMINAKTTADCQRGFHTFLESRAPRAKKPVAAEHEHEPPPRKPAATPVPRRGLGTQLPPWLAPPRE